MKIRHLFILILFFCGCTANPVTFKQEFMIISEDTEINLGKKADPQIIKEFGYYKDERLQDYINEVGQRIARLSQRNYLSYQFKVLDSPILNAFALPGGYIYITRGLLAELNSEAELAGVLGHEIGHVACRHSVTKLSQAIGCQVLTAIAAAASPATRELAPITTILFDSILMGFGREKEFEADKSGILYMYKAGYDLKEMSKFLRYLARKASGPAGYDIYRSSHPDIFERIKMADAEAKVLMAMNISTSRISQKEMPLTVEELSVQKGGEILADEYKSHLEGLVYGPRERSRHIKIHVASQGENIQNIAQKVWGNTEKVKEIAEFNDLSPDTPLYPGQRVKIVF